jgi:ATP-dependent HslUV protease ATP-binding subunit HslU
VREIARVAAEVNDDVENIGARRLHTVLTTLLEEVLFDAPDNITATTIVVSPEMVRQKLGAIIEDRQLSRYVL